MNGQTNSVVEAGASTQAMIKAQKNSIHKK